jgi:hypothetical protein
MGSSAVRNQTTAIGRVSGRVLFIEFKADVLPSRPTEIFFFDGGEGRYKVSRGETSGETLPNRRTCHSAFILTLAVEWRSDTTCVRLRDCVTESHRRGATGGSFCLKRAFTEKMP